MTRKLTMEQLENILDTMDYGDMKKFLISYEEYVIFFILISLSVLIQKKKYYNNYIYKYLN